LDGYAFLHTIQTNEISYFSKVVGHSYGCYAPLLNGSTTVIYEGKPVGTPDASAFFRIIHDHNVVSSFWSPTALRIIRQNDPENKHSRKYNMDHFRALFVAGEHCDIDTLLWARKIFANKPVIDHYWQTETGAPVTSVCLGYEKHPVSSSVQISKKGNFESFGNYKHVFFKPVLTEIFEISVISKILKVHKLSQICYFALGRTFSTYVNFKNLGNFLFWKSEHTS